MNSRALNMLVGSGLKLEARGGDACYLVEMIGCLTGKSLLVTAPYDERGRLAVGVGDEVVIRYLGGDNSYAFYSRVLCVCADPYPYLHLAFPEGVQGVLTRRGTRLPIEGPCMSLAMLDRGRKISVMMADISIHGARLIAPYRLGEIGETFSIEMPQIPAAGDEPLALPCVIRHVQAQRGEGGDEKVHHGVEFDQLEQAAQLFIARFIQDSIVRQRRVG